MLVYVNVKQAGSRKNALTKMPYEIDFEKGTLAELIAVFTAGEVARYNKAKQNTLHNAYLLGEDDRLSDIGLKAKSADLTEAVRTALEGYEDGLVRILKNEEELSDLSEEVTVHEGDVFTFIRLTFLAGRMW